MEQRRRTGADVAHWQLVNTDSAQYRMKLLLSDVGVTEHRWSMCSFSWVELIGTDSGAALWHAAIGHFIDMDCDRLNARSCGNVASSLLSASGAVGCLAAYVVYRLKSVCQGSLAACNCITGYHLEPTNINEERDIESPLIRWPIH
ncbi:hypothetical protein WOLCODRAFT_134926 [Wolfiporia cocos MD-104 SS10]|uniref:Uncharacterized protein n=1 Tax=Wolfiporia cocos (strain MD-104) TaxID=742152 RepID=A0A2H3IT03_WOLCO|nr:hypothetical protein WOLCODRAFT_134926 [Wolfiporia cocos MD-104 SS10]